MSWRNNGKLCFIIQVIITLWIWIGFLTGSYYLYKVSLTFPFPTFISFLITAGIFVPSLIAVGFINYYIYEELEYRIFDIDYYDRV